MIDKLELPFPVLSDPDRSKAIEPYGVADPVHQRNIAIPATVVIGPDGEEKSRTVSRDFADRPMDDDIIAAVRALGLPATTQDTPKLGPSQPSPTAFKVEHMLPYYRGARFAAIAMGGRFPEAKDDATRYVSQLDRYSEAAKELYKRKHSTG